MAYVTLMQDWTTIQTTGTTVQAEDQWLDMGDFLDVAFYISTQAVSGTAPTLAFRTSPSKDNDLFSTMTGASQALTANAQNILIVRYALAATTVPLAKYVRWEFSGTSASATFRVYAAATTQGALLGR